MIVRILASALLLSTSPAMPTGQVQETQRSSQTFVHISRADCSRLVEHRPDPGVEYQPGVDARGRFVPPAEIPGTAFHVEVPEQLMLELYINPLRGDAATRLAQSDLYLGQVQIDRRTGEATLNGRPLAPPEQLDLARKCQEVLRQRR